MCCSLLFLVEILSRVLCRPNHTQGRDVYASWKLDTEVQQKFLLIDNTATTSVRVFSL